MIALVVKATFILAAAFCAAAGLRRGSAALRHFIWTAALAAILLLPIARLVPQPAPIAAPAIVVAAVTQVSTAPATPSPSPSLPWLAILYGMGAALAAARFLAGSWRTSRMARRGTPSTLGADLGVIVLLSSDTPMPLAWGILRPLILLPQSATAWPADRLRSVLLHEAMHHRRRDLLAQAIGQLACCAYWFHPLAWFALARQRAERENACDDAVLRHGIAAHDYAEHLVEAARSAAAARPRWADAPAMAEASGLERRVLAVLNGHANRRALTGAAAFAVAIGFALLVAPLALVTLHAQATATLSGVVEDPSGGRVPNARVTARNLDTGGIDEATADSAGEYRFPNLASGRYEIQIASRGFALLKIPTTVVSGASSRVDGHLAIGSATESLQVHASRTVAPPAPQTAAAPRRIPVGGNVQAMKLVRQPRPEYPPELRAAGVEGTVVLQAVISKEGSPLELRVLSATDARLNQAALNAVTKWRYTPTLLNGQPVETQTTINIEFHLDQ
jgi:TonB family protein